MSDQAIQLMHGDCLELMPFIPGGSVDCICTDLPYGTTACAWDTVIPFTPLWEAYKRVVKPNGAIVLFGSQPFTSALVMSNPKEFKYDWSWRKPKGTGHLNANKQPMRDKEDILVFYCQQPTFNPQMSEGTPFRNKAGKDPLSRSSMSDCYGGFTNFRNENPGVRCPKQTLEFGVVERDNLHPTQKPVALLEYLIRTYTNPGDTVLDSCMGSASTAIACMRTGRKFIGIEKDEGYFQICLDRVKDEQRQGRLFTV